MIKVGDKVYDSILRKVGTLIRKEGASGIVRFHGKENKALNGNRNFMHSCKFWSSECKEDLKTRQGLWYYAIADLRKVK